MWRGCLLLALPVTAVCSRGFSATRLQTASLPLAAPWCIKCQPPFASPECSLPAASRTQVRNPLESLKNVFKLISS